MSRVISKKNLKKMQQNVTEGQAQKNRAE
jgi:hypothetical protein